MKGAATNRVILEVRNAVNRNDRCPVNLRTVDHLLAGLRQDIELLERVKKLDLAPSTQLKKSQLSSDWLVTFASSNCPIRIVHENNFLQLNKNFLFISKFGPIGYQNFKFYGFTCNFYFLLKVSKRGNFAFVDSISKFNFFSILVYFLENIILVCF